MTATVAVAVLLVVAGLCWPPRPARAADPVVLESRPAADADVVGASGGAVRVRDGPEPVGPTAVADAMDLMALALLGGAPVGRCLEVTAEHQPPAVRDALLQVSAALRWGVQPDAAWASVDPVWAPAGAALSLAERAGVPPAELLRQAAGRVRDDEAHRLEVAAARLSVRIVIPLGLCFLPAFVLLTVVPLVLAVARSLLSVA